jgi:type II secretory pathway pseudopilin PulG
MAAIIVGLAVMAVVMTAAMPVWKQMVQREKEEELVFRGEQYAHAIGMFQRRTANAYPPNLDVLVQGKYIRKKYKDPITNDDFVPLANTQGGAQRGAQPGQAGQAGPAAGQQGRGQPQAGAAAPGAAAPVGGVIGVTSKSPDTSIRLYKGRSHYNEWAFVYTPPANAAGAGGAAGVAAPGAPGRGQGQGRGQQGQPPQFPNLPGGGVPNPARGGRGAGAQGVPGGGGGRGR